MKFFFIILIICFYIISQTPIDARATGLGKDYWPLSTNGDYQGDLLHQKFERKRQAGMHGIFHLFIFIFLKSRLG